MANVSKHRNGTPHRSNGTVEGTEIGRVAREIRRLDDACHTLAVGDDAIGEQVVARQDDDYEAARDRFLIGRASAVVDGKADALRRLLVFETPTTFEDVTTLFNILEAELQHFHLHYLDDRWQFEPEDLVAVEDHRRSVSDQERYAFSQHEKRIEILTRSIFLALHNLAPSPMTREHDVQEARQRIAVDDLVETARKYSAGGANV